MFVELNEAGNSSRIGINTDHVWKVCACDNNTTEILFIHGEKLVVTDSFLDVEYVLKHGHPKEQGGYSKGKMTFA